MRERIEALDGLRGLSLLGIVGANAMWFSGWAVASPATREAIGAGVVDEVVTFALHVLVDGKFYALFSLLFGAGFWLLTERLAREGSSVAGPVVRRLLALAVVGSLHATLLWFGDIVSLYAVAAIPLYWVRRWTVGRQLVVAGIALVAPVVISGSIWAVMQIVGVPATATGHGPAALLPVFRDGSYVQMLGANATFLVERWVLAAYSSRLIRIFGLFVLGIVLIRVRPTPSRRTVVWLLVIAIPTNLALAGFADVPVRPPSGVGIGRDAIYAVAVPSGALTWAAVSWPWLSSGGAVPRALAAAGRLSLTCYLGQSLALAILFYGWGFGAWGELGAAAAVAVALAFVAVQVAVSRPWLRHVGLGPAEWVLRTGS